MKKYLIAMLLTGCAAVPLCPEVPKSEPRSPVPESAPVPACYDTIAVVRRVIGMDFSCPHVAHTLYLTEFSEKEFDGVETYYLATCTCTYRAD